MGGIVKGIIILILAVLSSCNECISCHHNEHQGYPQIYPTKDGSVTYLNDSIIVIKTHKKGLDNFETEIINLKAIK